MLTLVAGVWSVAVIALVFVRLQPSAVLWAVSLTITAAAVWTALRHDRETR